MSIENMKDTLILQDKSYISARRVHELFGYTSDYVGELCRAGKLDCKMVGRSWFVTEKSIIDYKSNVNEVIKVKSKEKRKISKKIYNSSLKKNSEDPISKNTSIILLEKSPILLLPSPIQKEDIPVSQLLVYQAENGPLIPELKKEIAFVPKLFAMPNLQSVCVDYLSLENTRVSSLNYKYVFIIATLLFVSSFTFNISTNIKNTLSNTASQSYASVSSVSSEILASISRGFNGVSHFVIGFITGGKSKVALEKIEKVDTAGKSFDGIAVVPSTNSEVKDEIIKQKIRDSFSDEITIKPDKSGTAGVITPVFKKAKGDDFVYVLVPVKN